MTDEKSDKKSSLAGWAAVLTAVAALITAIGFPNFFPDLVKRFLTTSPSPPVPTPITQSTSAPTTQPTGGVEPVPTVSSPSEEVIDTFEDNNFKFQLQNCQREGGSGTVNCHLLVTNQADVARDLTLFGRYGGFYARFDSRCLDFSGNEYFSDAIQIGESEGQERVSARLLNGIPLKASVSFRLPPQVTKLAAIEIPFATSTDKTWKAEFRRNFVVK